MKAQEILRADLLDVLFDNRNKSYGAYSLRKHYTKRLWMAVMMTLLLAAALLAIRALAPGKAVAEDLHAAREVVLHNVEIPRIETPPPPPPPVQKTDVQKEMVKDAKPLRTPPKIQQQVKTTKFTPPVIKKDEEVNESVIPPVEEIATVDIVSQEGITVEEVRANIPPVVSSPDGVDGGTGVVEAPKVDENRIFEKVEVAARVDQSRWRRHLENRLVRYIENAAADGMPAGQYTVMVRFLVEKDGSIDRVKALNDPGYGLARGAEQVVKSGPNWEPGIQNGRKVRSFHTQPITFVILEG